VGQHDPLGKAGGARGVLHVDHVVGVQGVLAGLEFGVGDLLAQGHDIIPAEHAGHFLLAQIDDVFELRQLGALELAGLAVLELRADVVDHLDVFVGGAHAADQDQGLGIGLLHQVFQLEGAVGRVDGHHDGAELGGAELGVEPLGDVVGPDGDLVALLDPEGHEPLGHLVAHIAEFAVGVVDAQLVVHQRLAVPELLGDQIHQLPDGRFANFKLW
jgi:hypothetical protein